MKNSENDAAKNEIVTQQTQPEDMEKYRALIQVALNLDHDISNPLTSIIGNVKLLLMKYPDMDEQMEKKLRVILNESRRIEEIIKRVSDVKKSGNRNYAEKNGEKMIYVDRPAEKNGEEKLS